MCQAVLTRCAVRAVLPTVLEKAMHQVATEKVLGSTTLCVLTINPATGQLHSANLGDSGFLVLSPSKTHVSVHGQLMQVLMQVGLQQVERCYFPQPRCQLVGINWFLSARGTAIM